MPKAVPIFKNLIPLTEYFLKKLFFCIFKKKILLMDRIFTIAFFLISPFFGITQVSPNNYPQHYFRDPLDIPISLAGNFGELRPDHFHMGLDIRTQKREHLKVYAAADGYIAQIKIEPGGFGQAIYINHPNGYTTVYAHLQEFFPALASYIKKEQYRQQSWAISLMIPDSLFPVTKGDFIAYSGTTGGSEAPHLHFEIRRTTDDINLNPLLFGLPVEDQVPPSILELAIYDRSKSIYEQSPELIRMQKYKSAHGVLPGLITLHSPLVGFGISAIDKQSGSANHIGIYEAILFDKGKEIIRFDMNNISYVDTRNINGHIDYKTRAAGGPYIQQLFCLPGYLNSIYKLSSGDGTIDLSDGAIHWIRIDVKDAYGNSVSLTYRVHYNKGITGTLPEAEGKLCFPGNADRIEFNDLQVEIGKGSLYDSVHISYSDTAAGQLGEISAVYSIGSLAVPLQDYITVRIRPTSPLDSVRMERIVMQRSYGTRKEVKKVAWREGWAEARFRSFGRFQLVLDQEPPVILPVGDIDGKDLSKGLRIAFTVKDNLGTTKNFRGDLDGKWLLFSNDKSRAFIYKFDDRCLPGPHTIKISVCDEAGNEAVSNFRFLR
jgi:murein DD-endopeptidase MepM/ murein hydrolase activator NlpD